MTDIAPTLTPEAVLPSRKVFFVVAILLATLIAGWLVSGVVEERQQRQAETLDGFQTSWGPTQILRGPLLIVPYQLGADKPRRYLKIAPHALTAKTSLSPEERKRGLFHATVYSANVDLQGAFTIPKIDSFGPDATVHWSEAFVVVNTATLSGMTSADHITWNGAAVPWQNCRELASQDDCTTSSALVARAPFLAAPAAGASISFGASLTLRGTGTYSQALMGAATDATIQAPWATPSFGGSLLPSESDVTEGGFAAHWRNADFSQPKAWTSSWIVEALGKDDVVSTVELLEPTPTYRMINRASKYNLLFVALSFTTYFLFELLTKTRIHPLQYALLGGSLTLFALLLISFAEMIGYDAGYAVAAGLVLLQASGYTAAVTRKIAHAGLFTLMLSSLFGFLYVVLSLESYSLLVGSLGLFVVLSLVMVLTQRVRWVAAPAPSAA
jgi:inner membrane protein